jgi:hypothetical protein
MMKVVALALAACCGVTRAAPGDNSADGRWRVEGQGTAVIVLDAGLPVKTLPARSLGGGTESAVSSVRYQPQRRSFVIGFATLPELWEISVDPSSPPVFDGLVHDFRMGEAISAPGFLRARRTLLTAPVQALAIDAGNNAHVLALSAQAWWLVNLDIRRAITRFELTNNPALAGQGER